MTSVNKPEQIETAPAQQAAPELIVRTEGRAGRITLNRPAALNALTLQMVRGIAGALEKWRGDAAVQLVVIDGAGDRGLCAGGDIKSFYDAKLRGDREFARTFWAEEYRLNAVIARYPKPFVAIMDGIVMGGGIGVSAHGSHRIVTERSRLAMPETAIGLVPDVGGTHLLANAAGGLGPFLALTGSQMGPGDGIACGFADHFVPGDRLAEFIEQLANPFAQDVDGIVDRFAASPPQGKLAGDRARIDGVFQHQRLEDITAALTALDDPWSRDILAKLAKRSPTCQKLTLAAIHELRRGGTLEDALNLEFRMTTRLFDRGEFVEGIRALLVDKDQTPGWKPATVEAVSDQLVADYMGPMLPGEDLGLQQYA